MIRTSLRESPDRARNPYTPNAGAPPRFFAGRATEVEDFRILLQRLARGYTEQSVVVTGLRGVGKTVLLGEYRRIADEEGWSAHRRRGLQEHRLRAADGQPCPPRPAPGLPKARWGVRARTAAATLKSFSLTVQPDGSLTSGLDVEPNVGRGDTGILNEDLADVFEAIGEAAKEKDRGVIFLFDEIQFLSKTELEALIGAVHRTVQRQLPVTFAGAGLPQLPGLAGEAKSYAERLFKFPMIGELPDAAARAAVVEPARAEGVEYQADAVDRIVDYTEGYPYFLQEYGRAAWNLADGPTITRSDVEAAGDVVDAELDESFFRARVQRASRRASVHAGHGSARRRRPHGK